MALLLLCGGLRAHVWIGDYRTDSGSESKDTQNAVVGLMRPARNLCRLFRDIAGGTYRMDFPARGNRPSAVLDVFKAPAISRGICASGNRSILGNGKIRNKKGRTGRREA